MILTDDDMLVLKLCIKCKVAYRVALLIFPEYDKAARRLMARGILYHVFSDEADCYALSAKGVQLAIELGLIDSLEGR